jgi:hypothetical protein
VYFDSFSHAVGIASTNDVAITSSHSIVMQSRVVRRRAVARKKRLFGSANAAQQRHNFAFVLVDGQFEGGVAVTAGKRLSRKHENNAMQQNIGSKF